MKKFTFDFYDKSSLKIYNLNESMRYQLAILDSLDAYTRKHSENVANLTCRICGYLHKDEGFTAFATTCAYLHDIGKSSIPARILQKQGPLTDDEYEIMKQHPSLGNNICLKDPELKMYRAGALYHHEALDGSGYPQGLKKSQIPYEGQIIRVADEFDAIVSKRQYKSHVNISDALEIVVKNSRPSSLMQRHGKTNPEIVRALVKVVIDDTAYEIFSLESYISEIKEDIKRVKKALSYKKTADKSRSQKKKNYYLNGYNMYLLPTEKNQNMSIALDELSVNLHSRKKDLSSLRKELKKIKLLRLGV
ncbi:MAG: HD domain-containing protein [Eubacteriales bacterium]